MVELYSESRRYTLLEVKDMTDNYAKKIGEGRSGAVYHGKLLTGQEVAVKLWKPGYHLYADEFGVFQRVSSPNARSASHVWSFHVVWSIMKNFERL
jgi:RIO-like serine/threonine protein kinase